MTLLLWILLGISAGWVSSLLLNTRATQGLVTDIILGIVGALTGGLLLSILVQPGLSGFNVYSLAVIVLGSIALIWLGRIINAPSR